MQATYTIIKALGADQQGSAKGHPQEVSSDLMTYHDARASIELLGAGYTMFNTRAI